MAENLRDLATESSSTYQDLEKQTVDTILRQMNAEDKTVPLAVEKVIPAIEALVHEIVKRMKQGGRLFYIGAGTSGRLGVVDASECPPTYGVPPDWVIAVAAEAKFPIEVVVGPEYVTGSTRMKSGTAQKLVLNMLSTAVMIQLGRVRGNKMVDMQLSNHKLVLRAIHMVREATGVSDEVAAELLEKYGSVRNAVDAIQEK